MGRNGPACPVSDIQTSMSYHSLSSVQIFRRLQSLSLLINSLRLVIDHPARRRESVLWVLSHWSLRSESSPTTGSNSSVFNRQLMNPHDPILMSQLHRVSLVWYPCDLLERISRLVTSVRKLSVECAAVLALRGDFLREHSRGCCEHIRPLFRGFILTYVLSSQYPEHLTADTRSDIHLVFFKPSTFRRPTDEGERPCCGSIIPAM